MKINSQKEERINPPRQTRPASTSKESVKTAVSSESKMINTGGRDNSFIDVRRNRVDLMNRSLDSLIKSLSSGLKKHRSLIPLLRILKDLPSDQNGFPADTSDRRLLLKIIREWNKQNGRNLTAKALSDLEVLERLLKPGEEERYLLVLKEEPSHPGLKIREESDFPPDEDDSGENGADRLQLDLDLERLGPVRVLLEQRGGQNSMIIQTDRKRVIRKALPLFIENIRKRGLSLKGILLQSKKTGQSGKSKRIQNGVNIWG